MRAKLAAVAVALSCLVSLGAMAGVAYTYDGLGRLTKAAYDNGKEIDYTYDQAGNRSQVVTQASPPHAGVAQHAPAKAKKSKRKRH